MAQGKRNLTHNYFKDIFVIVFISSLVYIRRITGQENVTWIGLITYAGFLISLCDLFYECIITYRNLGNKTRMGLFIILSLIISGILIFRIASIFTGVITLSSTQNDIYTLLTLLITLPHKLYIQIVGIIWFKKEKSYAE